MHAVYLEVETPTHNTHGRTHRRYRMGSAGQVPGKRRVRRKHPLYQRQSQQEPAARHLASSSAAAAQLVYWRHASRQLEAGADVSHTKRKVAGRPFSTRAKPLGQFRSPTMPQALVGPRLCSKIIAGCASRPPLTLWIRTNTTSELRRITRITT